MHRFENVFQINVVTMLKSLAILFFEWITNWVRNYFSVAVMKESNLNEQFCKSQFCKNIIKLFGK